MFPPVKEEVNAEKKKRVTRKKPAGEKKEIEKKETGKTPRMRKKAKGTLTVR